MPVKRVQSTLGPNEEDNNATGMDLNLDLGVDGNGQLSEGGPVAIKYRRYKSNNALAHECQRLLALTATPTPDQLASLVQKYLIRNGHDPSVQSHRVRALVKEWFRKRREYLASKIYRVCDELMPALWSDLSASAADRSSSYDQLVELIVDDELVVECVRLESKLPITVDEAAREFVRQKIRDYFYKLCVAVA
jgi:hypothetical protein